MLAAATPFIFSPLDAAGLRHADIFFATPSDAMLHAADTHYATSIRYAIAAAYVYDALPLDSAAAADDADERYVINTTCWYERHIVIFADTRQR